MNVDMVVTTCWPGGYFFAIDIAAPPHRETSVVGPLSVLGRSINQSMNKNPTTTTPFTSKEETIIYDGG